ncbi:glycosyltransferase family 2 protein [Lichenihabitans sp. Uapishka_5]|uniref:glycosyltransferase n=1 Tax=Lichenihabitans sp. Uapishka_5 TaxID=3037302 RepID=UPI0029E804CD|nr:glycosyltransferase family 2 protein [Lichenihabitans sp. Uapishka_5]MDX7952283.1 glycosyltransferase family 2 protein [Lichenihabitans sp. Uapishka_5]
MPPRPVLSGVVAFHPDPVHLSALCDGLAAQSTRVVVVMNSALPPDLRQRLASLPNLTLIDAGRNRGIGAALNLIAAEAADTDAVALFDQDSSPPDDLIARLQAAWARLVDAGEHPAVVGPVLVARPGSPGKAPTYRFAAADAGRDLRRVAFLPTSGSLIQAAALRWVGPFRDDYFIDGIDLEWCFRATAAGLTCWLDTACTMPHSVGSGVIGGGRLRWSMPNQRPFRMYCLLRNTIYGLRLRHIPLGWKLRQLAYLPLQMAAFLVRHRFRWAVTRQLLLGLRDGLAGRLGPPPILP